ncbi:MAG: PP2C family protein-serine/threonine phosphatase [bacterium]
METLNCINRVISKLDILLQLVIENQQIGRISLEEFLEKCFEIIKECSLAQKVYFSLSKPDKDLFYELSIKDEVIGYIVFEGSVDKTILDIVAYSIRHVVLIFISLDELYSSLSRLNYISSRFNTYRKAFYDISRAMLFSLSEETILKIICQTTQEIILCSSCVIFFRNKVVYSVSNNLIEQELNFVIPELKSKLDKKFEVFYAEQQVLKLDSVYLKHLKSALIKRFNVPMLGSGTFILLFTRDIDLSVLDIDFLSTVTSNIATVLETRNLFEQLAIKNRFLEKLFIGSTKLSEVNSFDELYQYLYNVTRDIFSVGDFIIFARKKGDVFKTAYIRISNPKLYSFIEASELSILSIPEDLSQRFSSYKSLIVFKDDEYKNDLIRFFDLIFQRPYIVIPIIEKNTITSLITFDVKYQFLVTYHGILDILLNHLSVMFSYVFSRVSAYEKLLAKSNESGIINKVIFEYSSIRDINVLISSIVKEIKNLVNYSLPVFAYYKNGNILVMKTLDHYKSLVNTVVGNLPDLILKKIKESVSLTSKGKFKPILINNLELFFDNINVYDFVKKSEIKSLLILPMKSEVFDLQPLIMVFSLSSRFEQEYIELLYSLANHFSIFFENASIYSFLEERLKATDILYNFLRIVTSVLDPYNVIMNAKEFIQELLKPEVFYFILRKYNSFEVFYAHPDSREVDYRSITKALGLMGSNITIINQRNVSVDKNFKKIWNEISKVSKGDLRQIITLPIVYLREILGYIILGTARDNIGDMGMLIINNIPYVLATPLKNSMVMQEQVEISNIIRQALTTKVDKVSLCDTKVELRYKHVASREITADWLEVVNKKDSLVLVVADVSGKGAKSAIYTAQAKFAAKSLFYSLEDFQMAVNQLNQILSSTVEDNTFITMLAVKLYKKDGKIFCEYVSAGHEPLIVIKKNRQVLTLSTRDIPLCIDQHYQYSSSIYQIEEGDILFLYTDGVIDIKDEKGNSFGRERLIKLLSTLPCENLKELVDKVYVEVMKFSTAPLMNPPDDITLVFVKV